MWTWSGSGYVVDTFIFICNACDVGLGFGPLWAEVWTGRSQQRRDAGGCWVDTRVERHPQRDDTTDVCAPAARERTTGGVAATRCWKPVAVADGREPQAPLTRRGGRSRGETDRHARAISRGH